MDSCKNIKNNIYTFHNLTDSEKRNLLNHLENCSGCKTHFDKINAINSMILDQGQPIDGSLFSEMETYWERKNLPDLIINPIFEKPVIVPTQNFIDRLKHFQFSRLISLRPVLVGFSILAAIAVVVFYPKEEQITLESLAAIEDINISYSVRSTSIDNLQLGIISLNQKYYQRANSSFNDFIANSEDGFTKYYAQYLLGLSYLKLAEEEKDYNSTLNTGIEQLELSLKNLDNFQLREKILWYLGKAHLLKKDIINAQSYFEEIIAMKGYKAEDSKILLQNLQGINR